MIVAGAFPALGMVGKSYISLSVKSADQANSGIDRKGVNDVVIVDYRMPAKICSLVSRLCCLPMQGSTICGLTENRTACYQSLSVEVVERSRGASTGKTKEKKRRCGGRQKPSLCRSNAALWSTELVQRHLSTTMATTKGHRVVCRTPYLVLILLATRQLQYAAIFSYFHF